MKNGHRRQYQQDLLFSSVVDLMSTVVCGIYPSVNVAYYQKAEQLAISTTALYNKLQGVGIEVSQGLLRETSTQLQELISSRTYALTLNVGWAMPTLTPHIMFKIPICVTPNLIYLPSD